MLTNNVKTKERMGAFKIKEVHKKRQSEEKGQRVIEGTKGERQLLERGGSQGNRLKAHFEYCVFIEF